RQRYFTRAGSDRGRTDFHVPGRTRAAAAFAAARLLGTGEARLPLQPRPADVPHAARQRRLQSLGGRAAAVRADSAGADRPASAWRTAGDGRAPDRSAA